MKKFIILALLILPMSMFAQAKFGHVKLSEIAEAMPEYKAAQTEIQNTAKQFQDEFDRMQAELKTKYEDYQKNGSTLPDAVKTRRETELQDLQTRLQQYSQTSQQELEKLQQTKMSEINDKITKAIQEVGASGGYTYIFSDATFMYIGTTATDLTAQVKAKLGIK